MSELVNVQQRLSVPLTAGVASFAALFSVFAYTMLLHSQAIEWPYLGFALVRISAISLGVAGIAFLFRTPPPSLVVAVLGALLGLAGGVAYVYATTA